MVSNYRDGSRSGRPFIRKNVFGHSIYPTYFSESTSFGMAAFNNRQRAPQMSQSPHITSPASAEDAYPPRLAVSVSDAARMVSLGRSTLYAAIKTGELPSLKIRKLRRIWLSDLLAWANAHRATPRTPRGSGATASDQRHQYEHEADLHRCGDGRLNYSRSAMSPRS